MEEVFIKLPRVTWLREERRFSEVKTIRIKLGDIHRYEEYGLDPDQQRALETSLGAKKLSKLIYTKYAEQRGDSMLLHTEHMVVVMSPEELDRKLNAE